MNPIFLKLSFSQISMNSNYDIRDSFMKLTYMLIYIFSIRESLI